MLEFFNSEEGDARFIVELAYKYGHRSFKETATNLQELLRVLPNSTACPESSGLILDQLSTIHDQPPPVPPKEFPHELLSCTPAQAREDHFEFWDPLIATIFEDPTFEIGLP